MSDLVNAVLLTEKDIKIEILQLEEQYQDLLDKLLEKEEEND